MLFVFRRVLTQVAAPTLWADVIDIIRDAHVHPGLSPFKTARDLRLFNRLVWGRPGLRRHLDHKQWKAWLSNGDALTDRTPLVRIDGTIGPATTPTEMTR